MKNARATAISAAASVGILASGWAVGALTAPAAHPLPNDRAPIPGNGASPLHLLTSATPTPSASALATKRPRRASPSALAQSASATPESSTEPRRTPSSDTTSEPPAQDTAPAQTQAPVRPVRTTAPSEPQPAVTQPPVQQQPQPQPVNNSRYVAGTYSASGSHRFGDIIVTATLSGDRITGASASDTAGDGRSQSIDQYALPQLREQVLSAQSSSLDGVSGATLTSRAYADAIQKILDQARR